jgi:hypothetical protein
VLLISLQLPLEKLSKKNLEKKLNVFIDVKIVGASVIAKWIYTTIGGTVNPVFVKDVSIDATVIR